MICPKCKTEVESLTKEHIVPKWLSNFAYCKILGIVDTYYEWNEFNLQNIEKICKECNGKKSGFLDYQSSITRYFARTLANKMLEECSKFENEDREIVLKPICQCGIVGTHEETPKSQESKKDNKETNSTYVKKSTQPSLDDIFGLHTNQR